MGHAILQDCLGRSCCLVGAVVARACSPCACQPLTPCPTWCTPPTPTNRAERSDSSWMSGFVMGGVVFGTLGFLFAPQISRALLGDDQRLRFPRFMEEEAPKDPEATKQELIDKIAQVRRGLLWLCRFCWFLYLLLCLAARFALLPSLSSTHHDPNQPNPQLNASIDEVAAQLKPKGEAEVVTAELS